MRGVGPGLEGVQENSKAQLCLRNREGGVGRLGSPLCIPHGHQRISENKKGNVEKVSNLEWLKKVGKAPAKRQNLSKQVFVHNCEMM